MSDINIINRISKNLRIQYLIIFLFIFYFHLPSSAQPRESRGHYAFGGCISLGISFVDTEALSDDFEYNGYNTFAPEKIYFGGLGYFIYNKFVFSVDGGFIRKSTESQLANIKYKNNIWFFNIGYSILSELKGVGFPFIGIGRGSSSLEFDRNTAAPVIFAARGLNPDDVVDYKSTVIQAGYTFLRMGDYTRVREKRGGLMFGLQGGYIYTLGSKNWRLNGSEFDSPKATFNGLYVRFMVGGWSGKIF